MTAAGSMFGIAGSAIKPLNPAGEFNSGKIVARGTQIEHWLNGVKVVDVNIADPTIQRASFARFRRATWGEAVRGQIVLQHMGHRVSFRNVRIRHLPDQAQ
jgi:hypothetical protein